ncbi:hypothetical protein SAMN05421505_11831 [Sinosporangium album]|uniref:Tetratricopeptide repeat-containing protein n=1 Tax=Sinosporangium album TaxID=504805 RepID=A0A1G8DF32_9ACTN|nr:hypothetical protein [Sinosporangium album]SDH56318.1 hypothetical protein SAMN05421505_11831 [Sinosporangium album]
MFICMAAVRSALPVPKARAAEAELVRALEIAESVGHTPMRARALVPLADVAEVRGHHDAQARHLEGAVGVHRGLRHPDTAKLEARLEALRAVHRSHRVDDPTC